MEKNIYIMENNIYIMENLSEEDANYLQTGIAEYDYAASEILKNAKTWFTRPATGNCYYRITHWNNIEIPEKGGNVIEEIVKSNYSESVAEKIIELIKKCSEGFTEVGIKSLTQFKKYWNHFFDITLITA